MLKHLMQARSAFYAETNAVPVAVEVGIVEYRVLLREYLRLLERFPDPHFKNAPGIRREINSPTGKLGLMFYGMAVRFIETESLLRLVKE